MDEVSKPSRQAKRRTMLVMLDVILAMAGIAAVGSLICEYGFNDAPPIKPFYLHVFQMLIVGVFVLDRVARLLLAAGKGAYFRRNWSDFALMVIAAGLVFLWDRPGEHVLPAASLYVIVTQAYLLVSLVIRSLSLNLKFAGSGMHPARLLLVSFGLLILAGSGLLMLPAAVHSSGLADWYYPDALFTATSATCVTGLVVRDTGTHFTRFGQGVILGMIQLGGLGIMLFGTVMAMMVGKALSLKGSLAIGQMLSTDGFGLIARAARFVLLATVLFELVGAAMLLPMFLTSLSAFGTPLDVPQAIWYSIFHSISAFCNAGFSLYGQNMMAGVGDSWQAGALRDHWQMLGVVAPLIMIGGIGFPVLQDLARYFRDTVRRLVRPSRGVLAAFFRRPRRARLTLHSKIVLMTTATLLVLGTAGAWFFESSSADEQVVGKHEIRSDNVRISTDLQSMSGTTKLREAFFLSITSRTAGFNTININELSNANKLMLCGLMSVGGSPAGTAGGMKTTTLAILFLAAYCMIRRRGELEVFKRSMAGVVLQRAAAIAILYGMLLMAVTLLLCHMMQGYAFIDLLFEASSACGTVGLSTGITRQLTMMAKIVVIGAMLAGRLGPLTIVLALTIRPRKTKYSYPSEHVIIG